MADFNEKHPELMEDEIFVGNIGCDEEPDDELLGSIYVPNEAEWDDYEWETKRLGEAGYDMNGNRRRDIRPVFVKREEYERAQVMLREWLKLA